MRKYAELKATFMNNKNFSIKMVKIQVSQMYMNYSAKFDKIILKNRNVLSIVLFLH